MPTHDIFQEFQNAVAGNKPRGDQKRPTEFQGDQRVRKAINEALRATGRHVFENENVKDMAAARERFAAIVAMTDDLTGPCC